MDDNNLSSDLRAIARKAKPGPNCLDDYELAALSAGADDIAGREKLEVHLSECTYCLERVAGLSALGSVSEDIEIPEQTLRRARALAQPQHGARHLARWATAAVIVLALGLVYLDQVSSPGRGSVPAATQDSLRQLRSVGHHDVRPQILAPAEGDRLSTSGGSIDWTEVSGSLYYDVRVVSLDGELISEERVTQTHWDVPAGLLHPGAEYYVRVDAYLAEARRLSSKHVLFSVEQS